MRKNWYDPFFFTGLGTTGYQGEIRKKYGLSDPNKGMRIGLFGRYMHSVLFLHEAFWGFKTFLEATEFMEKLYKRYRERIEGKEIPKYKITSGTNYIRELLERGFKAPEDIKAPEEDWWIKDKVHGLIFHKTSPSKDYMKDLYAKYAIKHYCTITQY
jgi:hypothetical protein